MPPNVHQFTRELEEAVSEKTGSRPVIIRWAVPIDDTQTVNFEFAQIDDRWHLSPDAITRPGFGQSGDRPYAERQRRPGDYDAQSSQRPIAIHALEHLASTDKGVIMLRRIVRDGIRDVAAGRDPKGVLRGPAGVIRTLTRDTVLRIPPEADAAAERRLLRETGRNVVAGG